MPATYAYTDDAPFSVPSGVSVHYVIGVTNTAGALTSFDDLVTVAAHVIPTAAGADGSVRYPKAVYMGAMDTGADVWVTWDGQDPVVGTTAPVGVKVPPTYPALRIPFPSGIVGDTIKLISDVALGTPVVLTYEF